MYTISSIKINTKIYETLSIVCHDLLCTSISFMKQEKYTDHDMTRLKA